METSVNWRHASRAQRPGEAPFSCLKMRCQEFCLKTGQHGFKYLAESSLHWTERILWALVILISTALSVYMIGVTWAYTEEYPTITVIETNRYNVWNTPFPAVTLCGINQLQYSQSLELTNRLKLPTGITSNDIVKDLLLLSNFIEMEEENLTPNLIRLQKIFDENNLTVSSVMRMLAPTCGSIIIKCMWKGRLLSNCQDMFYDLKTSGGFCCTFNYVGLRPEIRKVREMTNMAERRLSACGPNTALSVIVESRLEDYYDTILASQGYKVLIHNSLTYPDSNAIEVILSPGYRTFMAVSPIETYTAERLRSTTILRRHCLFDNEGELNTMKNYSYNSCIMECRKKLFLELCNCYPFYFPSLGNNKICKLTDIPCLSKNKYKFYSAGVDDAAFNAVKEEDDDIGNYRTAPQPCNCLPECFTVNYMVETTNIPFLTELNISDNDFESVAGGHHVDLIHAAAVWYLFDENFGISFTALAFIHARNDINPDNHSILHIFFLDLVATRYRTDVYYDWLQLLASVGGILGLMLGFSFTNAFEIIYIFTFRLIFDILRSRRLIEANLSNDIALSTGFKRIKPALNSEF